ncbi:hypothetical protein M011DRAFT_74801 [Sporormia fimetaria CBS 119925]|uniref:Uncharacterized protein n=1 Tax=Sporormia fimetaria CBS 119925 TaxID=1340428 RepID=A0A6A6V977_9PLEO|nr:hypothetical protein M011DRAFT_74801 [Sporormia fimetaria CBS 119925]
MELLSGKRQRSGYMLRPMLVSCTMVNQLVLSCCSRRPRRQSALSSRFRWAVGSWRGGCKRAVALMPTPCHMLSTFLVVQNLRLVRRVNWMKERYEYGRIR